MSLSQKIAAAFDARPDNGALPCTITVEDEQNRLTLDLTAVGPVGTAFDRLGFTTGARTAWSADDLNAWADRIALRVTYLMEPLVVVEHDRVGGEVEIRSETPTARGERRSFYEVRLNQQGTLTLARWAFDATTRRRQPASCQMTIEVLERLADDLARSVA